MKSAHTCPHCGLVGSHRDQGQGHSIHVRVCKGSRKGRRQLTIRKRGPECLSVPHFLAESWWHLVHLHLSKLGSHVLYSTVEDQNAVLAA